MSKCRSCDAPIVWAEHHRTGKRAPIDAEETEDGNVVMREMRDGEWFYSITDARSLEELDSSVPLDPRYTNHFATCPNAKAHRTDKERT